jgi:hypothetical protein
MVARDMNLDLERRMRELRVGFSHGEVTVEKVSEHAADD